ncbi:MAG: dTDP-4-dehydrorhamnose 3,5-epimerase [Candidatus Omnitrophota bacterium]
MIFHETRLKGAFVIDMEPKEDERGFLARSYCKEEFRLNGIDFSMVQNSISFNKKKGTVRGMHFQSAPYEEAKLVACIKGKIYDVIIDLRKGSPTCCHSYAIELSGDNHKMLYVPKGFAHGFQTLEDRTEILYQISEFYHPEASNGVRWNDKAFNISWPLEVTNISDKDKGYKDFSC